MKRKIAIAVGAVLVVGLLAAGAFVLSRQEGKNERDVAFASNMVPHHEGAVQMADMLLGKDGIPEDVRALAQRIKAAQQPEIDTMNGWLDQWGVDSMMGHGGHTMMISGMMSDDEMAALEDAEGREAARLFLEGMITHHKGAIEMAQVEVDQGQYAPAIAMAREIIGAQKSEITEMERLLADL
ncbi:DUF305 domain-containing protein [Pseudolysinimonas sp.]|jgi:uncharacterized protein (DUF305 family)